VLQDFYILHLFVCFTCLHPKTFFAHFPCGLSRYGACKARTVEWDTDVI